MMDEATKKRSMRPSTLLERAVERLLVPYVRFKMWLKRREYWVNQTLKCRKHDHLYNYSRDLCVHCGAEVPFGRE